MTRFRMFSLWCLLVLLTAGILAPAVVSAPPSAINVTVNEAVVRFAEEVRFRLVARADSPIQEVILFYKVAGSAVTDRTYPSFKPGREIEAQYIWELTSGDVAPGKEITYYWGLVDTAGQETFTEKRTFSYLDDRFKWREVTEGLVHVFTYQGTQGETLLKQALKQIEAQQQEIGITLNRPIYIYVYASRSDMKKALPSRSERYDEMTTTLGMVMAHDTLLLLGNAAGVEKTLAHELSHIVVGLATDSPLARLPRWLDEGLAMYAEGSLPSGNQSALERAIRRDQLISVRSLSGYSGDPEQVDLFYAEAYSLVSFLLKEYGRRKMLALLQEFKRGAHQEDALQKVYGLTIDELDAQWRQSLGLAPRPAPQTPATAPTPSAGPNPPAQSFPACLGLLPGMALAGLFFLLRPRSSAG